ncbi:MAG: TadE family protein [Bryobacteraceae bacterium]
MKSRQHSNKGTEKGSVMLEFALTALVLIPLFFGVVGVGLSLGNYIQVSQVTRDVAHIYARGVDFSEVETQDVAIRLTQGLGITRAGGNGVIILSRVITVTEADCEAANKKGNCPNQGETVFTQRLVLGNKALRPSNHGTPADGLLDGKGNIAAHNYLTNNTTVANGFKEQLIAAGVTQERGDVAFMVETFVETPSLAFLGAAAPDGLYCRFVF